ncbi:MAG TPA: DUF6331 family protein, partial [Abditibacteriaceae bacterium]
MTDEEYIAEQTFIEVDIPSPLKECLTHCEIHCVSGCCGVDAFSSEVEVLESWLSSDLVRRQPFAPRIALSQLRALIALAGDKSHKLSSPFLNAHTCRDAGRNSLLAFLRSFEVS